MTIDEAIEMYKKIANTDSNCPRYCMNPCEECVNECKQISEWLEELKDHRERECNHINEVLYEKGYSCGYNKAIDDFVEFASTMPTVEQKDGTIRPMWLKEMAEQLKVGVKE